MKETVSTRWTKATREPIEHTTLTVESLTTGREYEFRVSAVNMAGTGQPSDTSKTFKAKPAYGKFCLCSLYLNNCLFTFAIEIGQIQYTPARSQSVTFCLLVILALTYLSMVCLLYAPGAVCFSNMGEHVWSSGKAQDSWSLDHQNVVSSSPTTASVFVSLGKILNLNLLRWPERIWYLSVVGNITI